MPLTILAKRVKLHALMNLSIIGISGTNKDPKNEKVMLYLFCSCIHFIQSKKRSQEGTMGGGHPQLVGPEFWMW